MSRLQVLSTKQLQPDIVQQLDQLGFHVLQQDFISITYHTDAAIHEKIRRSVLKQQTAVFTSAHAVKAVAGAVTHDADWQVYCLSGKTKQALETMGWGDKITGMADDAAALAQRIISDGCTGVLFFCGDQRRDELPSLLGQQGIAIDELQVYSTIETPVIVTDAFDAVLFFSPSAVNSFFRANQLSANVICFAIGNTTAAAIYAKTSNRVMVAATAAQESVAAALIHHYKQNQQ